MVGNPFLVYSLTLTFPSTRLQIVRLGTLKSSAFRLTTLHDFTTNLFRSNPPQFFHLSPIPISTQLAPDPLLYPLPLHQIRPLSFPTSSFAPPKSNFPNPFTSFKNLPLSGALSSSSSSPFPLPSFSSSPSNYTILDLSLPDYSAIWIAGELLFLETEASEKPRWLYRSVSHLSTDSNQFNLLTSFPSLHSIASLVSKLL
jgi:hypothetical protein